MTYQMLKFIAKRDDHKCTWCGTDTVFPIPGIRHSTVLMRSAPWNTATYDSLIRSTENRSNLVLCCLECHQARGRRDILKWLDLVVKRYPASLDFLREKFRGMLAAFNDHGHRVKTYKPSIHDSRIRQVQAIDNVLIKIVSHLDEKATDENRAA
jgi:hypothetical protein